MTTNRDIVMEQLRDTLLRLKSRNLITEAEFKSINEDVCFLVPNMFEEKEAPQEAIDWNYNTKI